MKITCSFDDITTALSNMAIVVEDTLSTDDMKNIVFRVVNDTTVGEAVYLIGVNQIITYKVPLKRGTFTIEAEPTEFNSSDFVEFQLKSKELNSYLNTFKSVRRTKVTDVSFELIKNKVMVTTLESHIDTGREYRSNWMFDNIPVRQNMRPSLDLSIPEDAEMTVLDSVPMQLLTSSLLPVMSSGTNLYSKIAFSSDYAVAFSPAFTVLMHNFASEVFNNFCLSYRAMSFIKAVVCLDSQPTVTKTPDRVCIKMIDDDAEAYIRYDNKMPNYAMYEQMITNNHAIVLDRQYFKDVIKRLSLLNESIQFVVNMDTESVTVKNSKFNQDLTVMQSKAMDSMNNLTFKIMPDVLNKAIIGDDAAFSPVLFVYFEPLEKGGYNLILSDDSGSWHSVARVH